MQAWITYREAAEILGVYPSAVGKMIARGLLSSRGPTGSGRGALKRAQVENLAEQRRQAAAARSARSALPRPPRVEPQPPDIEHVWLTQQQVVRVLGITRQAVAYRCKRGLMPFTMHDGRRWVRLDHLGMQLRARWVEVTRQP